MISFIIAIVLLVIGFVTYGKVIEDNFGPDDRQTPAVAINDGVDFVPMKTWKVFLIQLLNIAGTGPIFGALSGALFGPVVYLWIVFGCIFAGAVHDYHCGMLSMRNNGAGIAELTGKYLGNGMRQVMRVFSVILLVMCGVVFTVGPAELLAMLTPEGLSRNVWLWVIIIYYFIATFVPIDKVIGRLYPIFGICLIAMAVGVGGSLMFSGRFDMPELWNNFENMHASGTHIWPFMFITVACGAISGFHATQSPMMARCCATEREGRLVFYGAMVAEGIIALVWAAAGVTVYENSQALLDAGGGCSAVVYAICQTTMGKVGSILAIVGVIACPITSGDTAYRSARLTIAEWFNIDQKKLQNRFLVTLPLLFAGTIICGLDYSVVWRYFSWSNQTLATIALWTIAVYLVHEKRHCLYAAIPATFMSAVVTTYFVTAPECLGMLWQSLGMEYATYYNIGVVAGICCAIALFMAFNLSFSKQLEAEMVQSNFESFVNLILAIMVTIGLACSIYSLIRADMLDKLDIACDVALYLYLAFYAFSGYKKPKNNYQKYGMWLYIVVLAVGAVVMTLDGRTAFAYPEFATALLVAFVSGRLNKLERNVHLLNIAILIQLAAAVGANIWQPVGFAGAVINTSSLIEIVVITYSYVSRYEEHVDMSKEFNEK